MITVDSIKVDGKVVATNVDGIVDTGTSLIVGGSNTIGTIAGLAIKQDCSTATSSLPTVTFTINGKDYELTGDD
jgi:fructoselysine-6-P-deglycase FrlB-like protein